MWFDQYRWIPWNYMTYAYFPEHQHTSRSKKTNKPPYYSEPSNGIHEFFLKRSGQVSCSKPSSGVVWSCYCPIFPTKKSAETQTSQRSSENVVTLTRILMGTGYCCIFWNGWHGFAIFPMSSLHNRPVISGVTCDMDTSTVPCITRKSVLTASRLRQVVDKEEYIQKKHTQDITRHVFFYAPFPFIWMLLQGPKRSKSFPTNPCLWLHSRGGFPRPGPLEPRILHLADVSGWKPDSPGILVNESLIKSVPTSDKGYSEYSKAPTLCITITN